MIASFGLVIVVGEPGNQIHKALAPVAVSRRRVAEHVSVVGAIAAIDREIGVAAGDQQVSTCASDDQIRAYAAVYMVLAGQAVNDFRRSGPYDLVPAGRSFDGGGREHQVGAVQLPRQVAFERQFIAPPVWAS